MLDVVNNEGVKMTKQNKVNILLVDDKNPDGSPSNAMPDGGSGPVSIHGPAPLKYRS